MSEKAKTTRKVTLMYRSVNSKGEATITSDRHHAENRGEIERIYRSNKASVPKMVVCEVPKGAAPWEIASELEPIVITGGKEFTCQITEMGTVGQILLNSFANGSLWDSQIVIVPESFVPKKEKSGTTDTTEASES